VFAARLQTDGATCTDFVGPSSQNPSVGQQSGTSSAAAVAGAQAVLVREYFERGFYPTGNPTPSDAMDPPASLVKAVLVHSAAELSYVSGSNSIDPGDSFNLVNAPDFYQGFGRITTANGLYFYNVGTSAFVYNVTTAFISTGETRRFCVRATGSSIPLRVTVAWTDPPASLAAGIALVNNVDLVVSDSNGNVYYANSGTGYDSLNNVEQVTVNNPNTGVGGAGDYMVYVYGHNIPQGPQEYALVISGLYDGNCGASLTCPRGCSLNGACDASTGLCSCVSPYSGPDCTLQPCASNCSNNGICTASGRCDCAAQWSGTDCSTPQSGNSATSSGPVIQNSSSGISTGAFAGAVVAAFIFGALLALFIGIFLGVKYAEHRRKRAKEKANQMLSVERRSSD
jgi:hypothetical protein